VETVKKIEIITNSLELTKVLEILEKSGISEYTVIENITGKGHRGRVIDDLETHTLTNVYVMSICTESQEQKLAEAIRPLIKKYGGICIVSDVKWIAQ
jgi:nitrogen regulatory protein PII